MRSFLRGFWRTVEVVFIVLLVYAVSLLFHEQTIPAGWVEALARAYLPTNLVFHVKGVSIGLSSVTVRGARLFDLAQAEPTRAVASVERLVVEPIKRHVYAFGVKYPRLPDGYYAPGNLEKNVRVEATFPACPQFSFELRQPDILGVAPENVTGLVRIEPKRIDVSGINLVWPDLDHHMELDGRCRIDLEHQRLDGEVGGLAKQTHIRPLMVNLDIPSSMPYFDGFTDVPDPVPASCSWNVNLVNNDFDLELNLHPKALRYNGIPMRKADGKIRLHVYTRGTWLNYRTEVGPIKAVDLQGRNLSGSVLIQGTNGYNTVDVETKSALPFADVLRIGGFTGKYCEGDVIGDAEAKLQFRFPRAMTNNYEVMDGYGKVRVKNGYVMRLIPLAGVFDGIPALKGIAEQDALSADYTIDRGVIRTDGVFVEGGGFTIKLYGSFDAPKEALDFVARVDFARRDTVWGKILHPTTWLLTKTFFEKRLRGTPEKPKWEYITPIDRVLEAGKESP